MFFGLLRLSVLEGLSPGGGELFVVIEHVIGPRNVVANELALWFAILGGMPCFWARFWFVGRFQNRCFFAVFVALEQAVPLSLAFPTTES